MGAVKNIGLTEFPEQGPHLGSAVSVCFAYATAKTLPGIVVREDYEEPWVTILALTDGRYILSTECMYSATTGGARSE